MTKLDMTSFKLIHSIEMLDFAFTHFSDKADELVKSQNETDQRMAKLWFVVTSELKKDLAKTYKELCDYIKEDVEDGILPKHSSS